MPRRREQAQEWVTCLWMACARPSACWMVLAGNDKFAANMQGPSMPMQERDTRMAGGELLAGTLR